MDQKISLRLSKKAADVEKAIPSLSINAVNTTPNKNIQIFLHQQFENNENFLELIDTVVILYQAYQTHHRGPK